MRTARTLIVNTNGSTDGPGRAAHRLTTVLVAGARDRLVRDPAERRPVVRLPGQATCRRAPECTVFNLSVRTAKFGDARRLRLRRKPLVTTLSVHPWPTSVSRNTSRPPGIACPPGCRHAFPAGTLVRLVARPANGWHLLSWGQACTGPAGCVVRMRATRRARARFAADTAGLGTAVARYVRSRQSRVGIAVYDANTHTTYGLNQAATFQTASIVKTQILGAVLQRAQAQRRPLTAVARANLAAMIQRSDNHAATTLWHLLGGASAVAAFDRLVPMPATTPHPAWGLTTTTAADNVRLLRAVAFPNATLTPRHRAYGLSLLEQVVREQRWGVAAGVAPGTVVALKNGWLPLADPAHWRVNSIGWVRGAHRNYVVAVLTDHNPSMQYGIDTSSSAACCGTVLVPDQTPPRVRVTSRHLHDAAPAPPQRADPRRRGRRQHRHPAGLLRPHLGRLPGPLRPHLA
jgi:beta-lactamase class A